MRVRLSREAPLFPINLFDESDRNLRKLVQLLYALVGPSFVLILFLVGREQVLWSALATVFICVSAVAIVSFAKTIGPYLWIFPGGVAPVLCCGLAAVSLGPLGWVFLAVSTAPIAWASVLFSAPTVIGALASGVLVCFTVLTLQGDWVFGLLSTTIYLVIQGLVAWVAFAKANTLRGARLETLASQIDEMELTMTCDGHLTFANDHAAREYGYSVDQLCRMNIRDLRADADSVVFRQQFSEAQKQGVRFEAVHRRADGTTFPVEVNSRRFWSQGRTLVHSVIRDISERRALMAELLKTRERYQMIFDHSTTGNALFDNNCRLVVQNRTADQSVGLTPGGGVGQTVEMLFGEETGHRFRQRIERVLQTKVAETLQSEYPAKEGTRWAESAIFPVFDGDLAKPSGVHVQVRDITAEKELETRVERAQKIDSLGVLAGGIAHDFNNLLAGLSGNVELARVHLRAGKVETALEKLDRTQQVFERAKALTQRVLTFSKGGAPVKQRELLGPLLERWAEFSLVGSSLQLESSIDPELWACNCDKDQISQIIDNLVVNPRQASHPGATVRLVAVNRDGAKHHISISVLDTGTGIDESLQTKIFDPFFTTKATGTGLGLTTAFSIAKRHEGWIEVNSKMGQGSTFTLFLPALTDAGPIAEPPAPLAEFGGKGWALVVDDQEPVRQATAEMLEQLGFQVLQAPDGGRGLETYREAVLHGNPPQVTLTDLTIPGGLGGHEMVRQLRAEGNKSLFVAMSGYFSEGEGPDFEGIFDGRLAKPFTLKEITQLLARHLG